MYAIRVSAAKAHNERFLERPRADDETNLHWFEQARAALPDHDGSAILLLGGRDVAHFRLRAAQSVARNDLSPSHWSHAALITRTDRPWTARTPLHEIALVPSQGFGWPPSCNAVVQARLSDYTRADLFPNVAVISVPCAPKDVERELTAFERKPLEVDAVSLLVTWLGYLWGSNTEGNPLQRSIGLPSAVLVDAVISSAWRDLTPGLATTASCPEAIWQAVKHWSEYHVATAPATGAAAGDAEVKKALSGFFWAADRLVPEERSGRVVYSGA